MPLLPEDIRKQVQEAFADLKAPVRLVIFTQTLECAHCRENRQLLEEIAAYFREVRKKYAKFEGSLRGVDSRILVAQVPGGMLTNMENQLREQGAADRMDDVLTEIPRVRQDLGYIPLVTPTSQIVGTQAVLNVLTGERYKTISNETKLYLQGRYGRAPGVVNSIVRQQAIGNEDVIDIRPADLLKDEMDSLRGDIGELATATRLLLVLALRLC